MKFDTYIVLSNLALFFLFLGGGIYLLGWYGDADPKTLKEIVLSCGALYLIFGSTAWVVNEIKV